MNEKRVTDALADSAGSANLARLYQDVNMGGTLNLLELAREQECKSFVFASSSSVYGPVAVPPFREDAALMPISPYAATKLAGEQICSNYSHLFGLRTINLRFFTVYGPRQRPDLAIHSFTKSIDQGKPDRKSVV